MQTPQPNLLIIGGSGFVSGTLACRALARGYRVWTVTRGQRPLPEGVIPLIADRRNDYEFTQVIQNAGVRWNLAVDCIAFNPEDTQQDALILRSLVDHLVFISTDFVYDPAQRRFPQNEAAAAYAAAGYGERKRRAEEMLIGADTCAMTWTILRPGHIYGPGSQLGCLPAHARDPQLLARIRRGEILRLAGGGYFLQQPILARDLAELILSLDGNPATYRQLFCVAGPEIIESRAYYQTIADILGVALRVEELPVETFLAAHPDATPFLCHRFYDLSKLAASGALLPRTPLVTGLREQIAAIEAASPA